MHVRLEINLRLCMLCVNLRFCMSPRPLRLLKLRLCILMINLTLTSTPLHPVKKAAKVVVERSFLCRALLMVGETRPTSKMSVTT